MRIYDNGIYRDATVEEIAVITAPTVDEQTVPSVEDRLADIESALEALLSGRTN